MDPLSASLFASIGSAFKFADVAVRVAEVGSENAVFVRTIQVVRSDLEEVERLLSQKSVQQKLAPMYGKINWIKTAIGNTRNALNEIGRWVERARVEQESTGSIRFDTRVRWVFSDHEKLLNRKIELSTCHQQLSNVLGYLIGLEVTQVRANPRLSVDASYVDDIVARHRRTRSPHVRTQLLEDMVKGRDYSISEQPAIDLGCVGFSRSPPIPRDCSPSNAQPAFHNERDKSLRSLSFASTSSPPGSPPPTYENAVSVGPLSYNMQASPVSKNRAASTSQGAYCETISQSPYKGTWAYRNTFEDSEVAELAGDTVVFSGTNPAGPVNPYELCASPSMTTHHSTRGFRRPYAGLAELMGDLQFSTEPTKNDLEPSSEYPPGLRSASDLIESTQKSHSWLRNSTMSETAPVIRRRPIPTNAFSDPFLTAHESPLLSAPYTAAPSMSNAKPLSYARLSTSENSSDLLSQVFSSERPSSRISCQSHQNSRASTPVLGRHLVESTSSCGTGNQPKEPRTLPGTESVKETRIQSQKRMMDLLNSIGT